MSLARSVSWGESGVDSTRAGEDALGYVDPGRRGGPILDVFKYKNGQGNQRRATTRSLSAGTTLLTTTSLPLLRHAHHLVSPPPPHRPPSQPSHPPTHPSQADHSPPRSDPAVKQILLQMDETTARFIIQDLDPTHLLIKPQDEERVRRLLEAELEKNNFVSLEL